MSKGIRSFGEVYEELPGAFRSEVDQALADAIDGLANADSGVEGATITIKLSAKRGRHGQIEIKPQHATSTKRSPHLSAAWYVTPRGELVSDDPRQEKLPLGNVATFVSGKKGGVQ